MGSWATSVLIAIASWTGVARATPATDALGAAYAAYDRDDLPGAAGALAKLDDTQLVAKDYALWIRGMVALRTGDAGAALADFRALAKLDSPHYRREVNWRIADAIWASGDHAGAAKDYAYLIAKPGADDAGDVGTAMWRIAETTPSEAAYRALVIAYPAHPMAALAEAKLATPITPAERIERAKHLTDEHEWDAAIDELSSIASLEPGSSSNTVKGGPQGADVATQRDYWMGTTLFKMRRRYGDSGELLLGVYKKLGGASAAEALFHGARALSRADRDDEAIANYKKVVANYGSSAFAPEASYLIGWLEFNRGNYKAAIGPLEKSLARFPKSKFSADALWFLAMSHYFLGDWKAAKAKLSELATHGAELEGGKGEYWLARVAEKTGHADEASASYTAAIKVHPFSWYALLARARLAARGIEVTPFGEAKGAAAAARGPKLADTVDEGLASDELIRRTDELALAGLGVDAGEELAAGEKAFLKRHHHATAFAMLLDRYRKAGNYNRPWMLAVSYSGSALDGEPAGDARRWWENAYPRAYQGLVEKYQALGKNPDGYLYSIMRKESGFNPHDLSYADAQGLLQMIPPTTQRVARELGIPYDEGRLYEPAYNIQTASWYIGHLLEKFKHQIPLGAGSFNSGPKPVMKWIDMYGDREMDEMVELVPYVQTREYMKKVTENFARYAYLYEGKVYEQPLTVDKDYVKDQLIY